MKTNVALIGIILCLSGVIAFGQDDCLQHFTRALDKTKSLRADAEKNGFQMDCRIIVTADNGKVSQEKVSVSTQGKKFRYITAKYELYQDAQTLLVIQHDRKVVYVSHPTPEKIRETQFMEMIELQDSLRRYMSLAKCEKEFGTVHPDEGYQKIRFVPGEKLKNSILKGVTYWVETSTGEVRKIAIDYKPGSDFLIKNYVMLIDKMSTKKPVVPFSGQALAVVMTGKKMKSAYSNYQLVDRRQ